MPARLSIPTVPITDDPKFSICLNEDWIPILVGQLKLLTQDFMWDSSDPSVLFDTEAQIADLISTWSENCFSSPYPLPNWNATLSGEGYYVVSYLNPNYQIPSGSLFWGDVRFIHVRNDQVPIGTILLTITFYDPLDFTSVGVILTDFVFGMDLHDDLVHVVTIDCLNEFAEFDGAGRVRMIDVYPDGNEHAIKEIQVLSYTSSIAGYIAGYNLYACGEA